jgi:hypothetical protein
MVRASLLVLAADMYECGQLVSYSKSVPLPEELVFELRAVGKASRNSSICFHSGLEECSRAGEYEPSF